MPKFSDLPAATELQPADLLALAQAGASRSANVGLLDGRYAPLPVKFRLEIEHTGSGEIRCAILLTERYNCADPANTQSTPIAKGGAATVGTGATQVDYALSAGGETVSVSFAAFTPVACLGADIVDNGSGTATLYVRPTITTGRLDLRFTTGGAMAAHDMATPTQVRQTRVDVVVV